MLLRDKESEIYAQHCSGRRLHNGGALLWSSRWGWSVTPTAQAQSYVSGYINVELAAQDNLPIMFSRWSFPMPSSPLLIRPLMSKRRWTHECVDRLRHAMLAVPPVRTEPIVVPPVMGDSAASDVTVLQEVLTANPTMSEQDGKPSLPYDHP